MIGRCCSHSSLFLLHLWLKIFNCLEYISPAEPVYRNQYNEHGHVLEYNDRYTRMDETLTGTVTSLY